MNQPVEPNRRTGLSRRDFVHGKFWRAFGLQRTEVDSSEEQSNGVSRRSLVMRYPKSQRDLAVADSTASRDVAAASSNSFTARRRTIPVLRPPGAIDELGFLEGCTRCGDCAKACPHDAITHAPVQFREAAGTPMVDPDNQPCMMCVDAPCITACQPNVLTTLVPRIMGTAKVTEHLCLAYHGTTCTVCSERCPVEGAIDVSAGKPTVNETACTGCGVCRYVCPAPENAILLMPSYQRPTSKQASQAND